MSSLLPESALTLWGSDETACYLFDLCFDFEADLLLFGSRDAGAGVCRHLGAQFDWRVSLK